MLYLYFNLLHKTKNMSNDTQKSKEYTFNMVWQMFAELGEQIKQNDKVLTEKFAETDKMIKSLSANNGAAEKELQEMRLQQKETDKILKIVSANIDKNAAAIKETNQAIGGISKSNGYMAEKAIFNALERDMSFADIKFDDIDRAKKRKIKKLNHTMLCLKMAIPLLS